MDEVVLHTSQKLEAVQLQLLSQCQHVKLIVHTYFDQVHDYLFDVWEGPAGDQIRENSQKVFHFIQEIYLEIRTIILNPSTIQRTFSRCLQNLSRFGTDITRKGIYFGCITFAFGGLIGLCLGLSWHKSLPPPPLMKAIVCTSYSGLDALTLVENMPAPIITSPDEVLVQVKAASVDFVDIKICSGYGRVLRKQLNRYNYNVHSEFPVTLGRDCCGVIVEVGQKCSRFEVGDEVWFSVPYYQPGTLSEYVVVRESIVAHKPKNVSFEACASVPYAGSIAWDAMVNRAGLGPANTRGKRILIHSGCSAIGCIILQLARIWGAHVTSTCSMRAIPVAQALGADEIVPFEEDIEKLLSSREPFDVIFNTVGPLVHDTCLKLAKPGGLVITTIATRIASDSYGFFFGSLCALWIRLKYMAQSLLGPCSWGLVMHGPHILDQLRQLVQDGAIQPVVDKIYSPQDAELAFQHVDSAESIGRTIIKFRYHRPLPHLQNSPFYTNYPLRQQSPYPPPFPPPTLLIQPPRGLS